MTHSIIIGNREDVHVSRVSDLLKRRGCRSLVVDADTIASVGYRVTGGTIAFNSTSLSGSSWRGWIRRYAPDGWMTGCELGSLEGVINRARLTLINHVAGTADVQWLTSRWPLMQAEERIFQLGVAERLGLKVPRSIVSNDLEEIGEYLGPEFVVKPIGASIFSFQGRPRVVYATAMTLKEGRKFDWSVAPFIAQQKLTVRTHLRVVTVGHKAWVAQLTAEGRPLDWRQQPEAHDSWLPGGSQEVVEFALSLASELKIGYSSQDWVSCDDGVYFLDLNPAGQWLFLPEPIASEVTTEVADFLAGAN